MARMRILRRLTAIVAFTAVAAGVTLAAPTTTADAAAPHGTLLIVPGQSLGAAPYTLMADALRRDGYRVRVLDLMGTQLLSDSRAIGRAVDAEKKARPSTPVSLVGHSVGGVTTRYYVKNLGGASKVANVIAVGTPEYGSPGGCNQPGADGQLCPGSAFLRELNAGDDTPGPTRYYRIRSAYEWVTGDLDGGQCRVTPLPAFVAPTGYTEHTAEAVNPAVFQAVSRAAAGHCDGQFVDQPDGQLTAENSLRPQR